MSGIHTTGGLTQPARVAVLLAAYNGRNWIEAQLISIQAQTRVDVEIYISIDPSSDGTEAWCTDYASAHPNVTVLSAAGPFKGASRNFFRLLKDVDLSGYDYVAFSDQDDVWYADKLERAVTTIIAQGMDAYSSNVMAFWQDGRRLLVDKAQPQVKWDYLFEAAGPGCTYVLSRPLAEAFKTLLLDRWRPVQGIDLHDWFCYAFARSRGYAWCIDPRPGLDYRQHERNQVGVNSGLSSALKRWRKINDGWWFAQVELTACLLDLDSPLVTLEGGSARITSLPRLALHAKECRRRMRDRVMLFIACVLKGLSAMGKR